MVSHNLFFSAFLLVCSCASFSAEVGLVDGPQRPKLSVPLPPPSAPRPEMETVVRLQHFEPGTALFRGACINWDGLAVMFETRRTTSKEPIVAGRFIWAGQRDAWFQSLRPTSTQTPLILIDYVVSDDYEKDQNVRNLCGHIHDGVLTTLPEVLKPGERRVDTTERRGDGYTKTKTEAVHTSSVHMVDFLNKWRMTSVYEWTLRSSLSLSDWVSKFDALRLEDQTYPLYALSGTSPVHRTLNCCAASVRLLSACGVPILNLDHGRARGATSLLGALAAGAGTGAAVGVGAAVCTTGPLAAVTAGPAALIGAGVGVATSVVSYLGISLMVGKGHQEVINGIFGNIQAIPGTKVVGRRLARPPEDRFKVTKSSGGVITQQHVDALGGDRAVFY